MSDSNSGKGSLAAAFMAGTALGVVAALLMAPKSGEETREDIKDTLGDAKDKVAKTVGDTKDTAKTKLSEAVDTTKTVAKEGKRAAKDAKERVKESKGKPDSNDDSREY